PRDLVCQLQMPGRMARKSQFGQAEQKFAGYSWQVGRRDDSKFGPGSHSGRTAKLGEAPGASRQGQAPRGTRRSHFSHGNARSKDMKIRILENSENLDAVVVLRALAASTFC